MKIEILTDDGFSSFHTIQRTFSTNCVELLFDDNTSIIATKNHKFFQSKIPVFVEYLVPGDIIDPGKKIVNITPSSPQYVYDVVETKNHKFLANDIVSHNCVFMGSSGSLVDGKTLEVLTSKEPIHRGNDLFNIFEMPKRDRIYALIADVSRGKGLDYSAFSVVDITEIPYRQVATFRDNMISPTEYAEVIDRVGKQYNEAAVLVELNDLGSQVSDILFDDYEYENMLYTESAGRLGKRISYRLGKSVDRGITTTKGVKGTGCSVLKLLIEQSQLIINDAQTIEELKTFSRRLNSYEAEPGNHDDLVMGLVLFAWLTTQQYFNDLTDINTMATLRERSREELETEMMPLGFMDDGIEDDPSNNPVVVGAGNQDSWLDDDRF